MSGAFGNVTLRRWEDVLADTQLIVDQNIQMGDPYFLRGIAFCNLGRYEEAEDAYTQAIDLDDSLGLAYLLRAEVRRKQGDLLGAGSDIAAGLAYPELARLGSALTVENMDAFDCTTFMDTDIAEVLGTAEATADVTSAP
jgi:tetratricopeptide (TPR) repeat protein